MICAQLVWSGPHWPPAALPRISFAGGWNPGEHAAIVVANAAMRPNRPKVIATREDNAFRNVVVGCGLRAPSGQFMGTSLVDGSVSSAAKKAQGVTVGPYHRTYNG